MKLSQLNLIIIHDKISDNIINSITKILTKFKIPAYNEEKIAFLAS